MTTEWIFLLILTLIFSLLTFFARLTQGSWLVPGAFFSLFWFISVFLSLIFAPDYYIWPGGILWIIVSSFAVYVGSIVGMGGIKQEFQKVKCVHFNKIDARYVRYENIPWLWQLTLIFSILGLGAALILLWSSEKDISVFFSVDPFVETAHEFSVARYSGDYSPPLLSRLMMIGIYLGALLGGVLFVVGNKLRYRVCAILPVVSALIYSSLTTARATVMYASIMLIAAYLSTHIVINRGKVRIPLMKTALLLSIVIPLFLAMMVILQMSREENTNLESFYDTLFNIRVYFFGHIPAFSTWLEKSFNYETGPNYGAFSLAGVYDILGIKIRAGGVYQIFVDISPSGVETNIYTAFRGLIDDFTLPGALLILFLIGALGGMAFSQVSKGKVIFLPILTAFYFFIIWTPITSIFNYNSILIAWLIFVLYFAIFTHSIRGALYGQLEQIKR